MKAITVRYLAATDTKGARLKAFDMDGNNVVAGRDFCMDVEDQARKLAFDLMTNLASSMKRPLKITGHGALSRNDTVFTIGYADIPVTISESIQQRREAIND